MATKKKAAKPAVKASGAKKTTKTSAKKAAPKSVKKAAPKATRKAAPKVAKKAAPKAAAKASTAKKPAEKKSTVKPKAAPKPKSKVEAPVSRKPKVEERIEPVQPIPSTIQMKEEPKKSGSKVFVFFLIIVVAVVAYLYLSKKGYIGKKESVVIKPPVTSMDIDKVEKVEKAPVVEEAVEAVKVEIEKETAAPPVEADAKYYTVQVKDQLTEISKKFYGNYADWKKIHAANKDKIDNPHLIHPGLRLRIPE